ncbi:IS110 family transposase [Shewanella sp. JBTF-M18]|uniref:IS110 family transposase n=2 Tax=Shewanella TaxID=22 RepID=A0A6L7I127_9GAMM|nr:IS110 family transposase [Shewanella insulae]MXR70269.1 IS110 family transposase [Shewanella insulae]
MKVTLIGIDLAKNVFQVCGVNQACKSVFNRALRRHQLMAFLAQYPDVIIAMEACSGSNYWGRSLKAQGYQVRLIPPQHVKPFVKGNKNDRNDAFAICEAAHRPNIQFVEPRTLEQVDMMLAHRIRERQVDARTTLINQIRGLLNEYGIVIAQGKESLKAALPDLIEDAENELTERARVHFTLLHQEWSAINEAIKSSEKDIKQQAQASEGAKLLMQIKGIGEITATAVVSFAGNGSSYKNGRHFSANIGLVPKEHSSGGKQSLGGITKRGNRYLRKLLIQCAWSIIRHCKTAQDRLSVWVKTLIERRGSHKSAVALANKLARIVWAILFKKTEFRAV